MELFSADWVHSQGSFVADAALLVDRGRVAAIGARQDLEAAHPDARRVHFAGQALAPGGVSAHSHCFQVLLRGASDHPSSFQDWVERHLYPLVLTLDEEALEAAALLCFMDMARAGTTAVGEFHYVHNRQGDFDPQDARLAQLVIGAARKVGLRVSFLRTIYDQSRREGQRRFQEPWEAAIARTRALAARYADDPCVRVLPAPHSLHGASREAIVASAALAEELDGPFHIHLAEQQDDVSFAKERTGYTPLFALERWGVLGPRTTLVHGIWLSEPERRLLAERGGALVTNPTTNMLLGDGICPVRELLDAGVPVAVGTDLNATCNPWLEARTAEMLQRVERLEMGQISAADGGAPRPGRVFDLATRNGARVLGLESGALEPGRWADFVTVDLDDPSLMTAGGLGGDALVSSFTGSLVAERAVRHVYVGGEPIVRAGEVLGVDRAELAARVRRVMSRA